ncbi:MAG: preprotein translocase subunit SecG [Deinococcales bacterium]|jgi:protein translocase SecG subunit
MFWIAFGLFVIDSILVTIVILMQEPKQSGLGDALGGGGGGDFGTMGGTAGGLHRLTIWLGVIWGLLALALQVIPRA